MEPKCADCKFFQEVFKWGLCRRNPPVANLESDSVNGTWPEVNDNDWCGEFAPRPEEDKPLEVPF